MMTMPHSFPSFPPALRMAAALATAGLLAGLLAACAAPPATASAGKPRLVVFLVVDGLPMHQVTQHRSQLAPDGFARFLDRGTWFSEAHYGHAYTVTAAGHATMLTGAYPHRSGIVGNEWRDPLSGDTTYCTGDVRYHYIDNVTHKLDGTSPANLRVETVGDVLRRGDERAKVIAISGKDRGAILPAGHRGTAYMYMDESGGFATSTYYMPRHPDWVQAFNAARPADRYFKAEWLPALPEAAYAQPLVESQPWFGTRPGKLPIRFGASDEQPGPAFYASLIRSPFVDQMSFDFARAAIAGEKLGQDEVPDILAISLSGHDYVNHYWSAESRLSHDHLLHLDRQLQAFFRHLDATVGPDNFVLVLTADHGFTPPPELSRMRGLDAGRVSSSAVLKQVNDELEKRFGTPRLARHFSASGLVMEKPLIAQKGLDLAAVTEAARAVLLATPGFAAAYTRGELAGGSRAGAPHFEAIRKTWHAERSGDIQYVLKPYWTFTSSSNLATHGSPHAYDTHVPILFYGPRWARAGRVDRRVEVADIAPTLAGLLGVAAPAASEGRPLPLDGR
jgi:predicted AlkP superfamily pyrophosphatase or phosphodiesterase